MRDRMQEARQLVEEEKVTKRELSYGVYVICLLDDIHACTHEQNNRGRPGNKAMKVHDLCLGLVWVWDRD